MFNKKCLVLATLIVVVVVGMLVTACQPPAPEKVVETVVVTQVVKGEEVQVVVTATPEPTKPAGPKTLVICQGQEPDSLYLYGTAMVASFQTLNAIYDAANLPNATDNLAFAYQPTITEKLPSLKDGDAIIQTVKVKAGDTVVNDAGDPVELAKGVMIRPAGCYSSDCAMEYDGSSEVEMEQMVATFKLVEGLTWADGTPVTAQDSVYSFKLYMDPDTPNPSRYTGEHTASYEAPDERTIVWTGLPGFRDATYLINILAPLPEHILGSMTAAEIVQSEEGSRTPMGYGPFTVEEWVAGDHLTMVKNPYYFRADEGLPKVDKVVMRFVGEDPNAAIAAALAGECDILTTETQLADQAKLLIDLEEKGQLFPTFVTGTMWEHVTFGINPVDEYAATRPDFFEDLRMRQAIAMCVDRQAVVDELLFGKSVVIHSYIPEEHPLYNKDVKQYPYDPEAAMALLEEMGWTDKDGDGIRECNGCKVEGAVDGTPLSFKWSSTTATLRVNAMQMFQANLAQCGFDVTLENLPANQYFADGPEGLIMGRHFDLAEFFWSTGVEPFCGAFLSTLTPSEENGWSGQNIAAFSNEEYDRVCNAALQSLPGTPDYEKYHKEAQRILAEQLPMFPLFLRIKLAAYRPEVKEFTVDPTAGSETWNIENLDIVKP